jgi:hypothetical protein
MIIEYKRNRNGVGEMNTVTEKNIEWINHIDKLFYANSKNSNNPQFYYYPDIQMEIESENINIIFRKLEKKTQILFGDNFGRKTYLSDVDIIKIIVTSEREVYEVICDILKLFILNPITEEINFNINNEDFYYKSIIKGDYNQSKIEILRMSFFETTADINIKYIDLITLISLIINKEFLVDLARGSDRVIRQSKKFLILSEFYKENKHLEELQRYGYDTSVTIDEVYFNSSIAKKIDVIFDKISF